MSPAAQATSHHAPNAALLIDPQHRAAHRALAAYYDKVNDPAKAAEQRRLADQNGPPR